MPIQNEKVKQHTFLQTMLADSYFPKHLIVRCRISCARWPVAQRCFDVGLKLLFGLVCALAGIDSIRTLQDKIGGTSSLSGAQRSITSIPAPGSPMSSAAWPTIPQAVSPNCFLELAQPTTHRKSRLIHASYILGPPRMLR
jgi:hypothetical protein